MNKVFNVEIDGQITLPDGRKLGPFEETTVNVVQPSECPSDPIVENAKQTGGFGYTEQGEQTTITWDGDASGLTVINGLAPFPYYKVGEAVELTTLQGATVNASGYFAEFFPHTILDSEINEIVEGLYAVRVETEPNQYLTMLIVCIETGEYYGLQIEGGVYFPKDGEDFMVSSLTYGGNTIHKIDEKYLPASGGGAMVVNFTGDEDGNVTSNKTVDEILDAESSGTNIIGVLYQDGDDVPIAEHMILTTVMRGVENKLGFVWFDTTVNAETFAITFQPLCVVYYNGTKWVAGRAT